MDCRRPRFAAREHVNPRTLTYWRWRLRADGPAALTTPRRVAPFVEVVAPPAVRDAPAGLEIVVPAGYRVRVSEVVVAETLRTVLEKTSGMHLTT